jgi:hypothetical protein
MKDDLVIGDVVLQIGKRVFPDIRFTYGLPGRELVTDSADHGLERLGVKQESDRLSTARLGLT